jgi:acyl-CoA thioester hydrolase
MYAPEPVIVEIWVDRIGNSSYTLGYRILDEVADLAAEASTVMAVVDAVSGRPIRMSDELRARLQPPRINT